MGLLMSINPDSILNDVLDIVRTHNRWRRLETINLIASENVMSPLAEYLYINDMEGRYAEGTLG
jgi:Glycine/serine hydroxymethyltransferase